MQGCPIHCKNCFNKGTWDFNGGQEWTPEKEAFFLALASRDYIQRVSILGGEPLSEPNCEGVKELIKKIPVSKHVWLYTGYSWEHLTDDQRATASLADYLVDGSYIDDLRDMRLEFRGSSNQRIIDIKKTLASGNMVLKGD